MVNIDTVYQTVLALANKEQRGYITPQEFNLFANHAQKEIFEQYFYDKNRVTKIPGNQTEFSDLDRLLDEKIQVFQRGPTLLTKVGNVHKYPASGDLLWRLGTVAVNGVEVSEVDHKIAISLQNSPLLKPTALNPIYVRKTDGIQLSPRTPNCEVTYVAAPSRVSWGYFVVGGKALYDSSVNKTTHFQFHPAEESELVYKILKLAGVSMAKLDVMRAGQIQEQSQQQQEKQ